MATHSVTTPDSVELDPGFRKIVPVAMAVGGIGVFAAAVLAYFTFDSSRTSFGDTPLRRFYFAYLVSYLFFLSISLGSLFFVLIQQLFRAGWSVGVRRIAETSASVLPALAILSAPIVLSVIINHGELYRWAQPITNVEHEQVGGGEAREHSEHGMSVTPHAEIASHVEPNAPGAENDKSVALSTEPKEETGQLHEAAPHGVRPLTEGILNKRTWLNPSGFLVRLGIYFGCWIGIGLGYYKASTEQDVSGDAQISLSMQKWAAPCIVLFALTFTLAAFDLVMSLDPTWYSTMFGVYYFAGCAGANMAMLILVSRFLQSRGKLVHTISQEHYHDLGKLLFAFTFFWGYIGFSQYMLQWYGNIPEEVAWWSRRGGTTVGSQMNGFTWLGILMPICRLIVPFAGLLSRHIKRNKYVLAFWAVWILAWHWADMFWMVMPEYDGTFHLGVIEPLCFIGIGGFWLATFVRHGVRHPLRPVHDPRLPESLAFQNI